MTSPVAPTRTGRRLLPLGLVFLSVGLSTALVFPFLSLFLDTAVRAGPVRVTVFLVAMPVSGMAAAWAIGRISDRWPIRRHLLIAASLAGMVGSATTAVVRNYWVLLAVAVTATAVAAALFPQTFAYARQVLLRDDPARAALGISALRTVFSIAWVAGPPLAALLLDLGGFRLAYGGSAVMYAVAALVAYRWLSNVEAPAPPPDEAAPDAEAPVPRVTIALILAGFTVLQTPLVLGVQAMPLFTSNDLGGEVFDAGLILGLCAALEIPLMLGLGMLTTRVPIRTLILLGAAAGIVYQALAATAHAVWVLAAAQVVNAFYIAAVSALGIPYVQDLMPDRPGRATTMYTNTFPLGQMLAGPLFGLAQHAGFRLAYVINLGLTVLGLILLSVARPGRSPGGLRRNRSQRAR